ncbi:hypothetical protein N8865_02260 [Francisellaceae bacterium]|nr:hypothetical protein [Francisellaceae bacterium]
MRWLVNSLILALLCSCASALIPARFGPLTADAIQQSSDQIKNFTGPLIQYLEASEVIVDKGESLAPHSVVVNAKDKVLFNISPIHLYGKLSFVITLPKNVDIGPLTPMSKIILTPHEFDGHFIPVGAKGKKIKFVANEMIDSWSCQIKHGEYANLFHANKKEREKVTGAVLNEAGDFWSSCSIA